MGNESEHVGDDHAAPVARSEGAAPGLAAPGLTFAASTSGRGWTPATVAALQRSAGNAAVAALLRKPVLPPPPTPLLQRDLAFGPALMGHGGPGTYGLIKEKLTLYHAERKSTVRLQLLLTIQSLITEWENKHGSSTARDDQDRAKTLGMLKRAIKLELPEATLHGEYVSDMYLGKFKYSSYESQREVGAADMLTFGETGVASGTGAKALQKILDYRLTEAEVLAIKTYSVGDYQTINPTLAGSDAWLRKKLPKVGGLLKDASGNQISEPEGPEPEEQQAKKAWTTKKKTYDTAAAALLAQTPLAAVKAEAQRHAALLLSGLGKLPRHNSATDGKTYRGIRLEWKEFLRDYGVGDVVWSQALLSTSKKPEQGKKFARKMFEDGYVGVLLVCTVKKGRDIEDLSAHGNEAEVLLLPGAGLKVMGPPRPGGTGYEYELDVTEV